MNAMTIFIFGAAAMAALTLFNGVASMAHGGGLAVLLVLLAMLTSVA